MRYELSDFEWTAIKPMLPNKTRGVRRVNDRRVLNGIFTPGEAHDNRLCSVLLSALLPQAMLLADRGYDADWIRELARQQGAWANIPPTLSQKPDLLQPLPVSRARSRRTVLQQDQAVSARRYPV